jgi:hypothetical protein
MADSDIIVSLHLVIPFISMGSTVVENLTEKFTSFTIWNILTMENALAYHTILKVLKWFDNEKCTSLLHIQNVFTIKSALAYCTIQRVLAMKNALACYTFKTISQWKMH